MKLKICDTVLTEIRNRVNASDEEMVFQIIKLIEQARSKAKSPDRGRFKRKYPNTDITLRITVNSMLYNMPPMISVMLISWITFDDIEETKKEVAALIFESQFLEESHT